MLRMAVRFTAFVASVVLASPQETPISEAKTYDDAEAYKVYSAILGQGWPQRKVGTRTLMIRTETEPYGMCISPDAESEKIVGTAIADYKKQNGQKWLLQRRFDIGTPYEMVPSGEIDTIFKTEGADGWKTYYERHPNSGGWIELSAVGFNPSKTIAVVYASHSCGWLWGYAALVEYGGKRILFDTAPKVIETLKSMPDPFAPGGEL